jgi:hypothetical protein
MKKKALIFFDANQEELYSLSIYYCDALQAISVIVFLSF